MTRGNSTDGVRLAAVAGQFYPGRGEELSRDLDRMLDACPAAAKAGKVRALISPHAGYIYSGMTAAKGFSLVRGQSYDRVLVVAPSHRMYLEGLAISGHTAFRTPLGDIEVDLGAAEDLVASGSGCIEFCSRAHDAEHALEVQLPFIQKTLPGTPILPVVCGHLSIPAEREASRLLSRFWNPQTLWVISSDFTHFGTSFGYVPFREEVEKNLKKLDMGAADTILALDGNAFNEYLHRTGATICGANPIRLLLSTIEQTKSNVKAKLLAYTNSGELSGDFSHCVGYCSIAFILEPISKLPVPARRAILDARQRRCGSGHTCLVCPDRGGVAFAPKEPAAQRVGSEARHSPRRNGRHRQFRRYPMPLMKPSPPTTDSWRCYFSDDMCS